MSDRYTYRVTWSEEAEEYVGLCQELPLLSWLAPQPEGAFAGIRRAVADAVQDMQSAGEAVPEPLVTRLTPGAYCSAFRPRSTANSRHRRPRRA